MTNKKYDAAVKVGEYQSNGETKARYLNVGAVLEGPNGPYLLLDRTFNPAGVPNPDNRSNLIVSLFEPRDKQQGQSPTGGSGRDNPPATEGDDIPF